MSILQLRAQQIQRPPTQPLPLPPAQVQQQPHPPCRRASPTVAYATPSTTSSANSHYQQPGTISSNSRHHQQRSSISSMDSAAIVSDAGCDEPLYSRIDHSNSAEISHHYRQQQLQQPPVSSTTPVNNIVEKNGGTATTTAGMNAPEWVTRCYIRDSTFVPIISKKKILTWGRYWDSSFRGTKTRNQYLMTVGKSFRSNLDELKMMQEPLFLLVLITLFRVYLLCICPYHERDWTTWTSWIRLKNFGIGNE